ncbi:ribosome-associated protein [Paraburkholderia bannensis]|uniref:Ribosomal silencing factor RsfS n=1 Tax=Paraburkholderia bannensis TaxID=765414 RepID=A0A7W9U0W0_9BURK|nr:MULTISPECIES: ribosome silencing factor [Paraburkholderia]MBB3258766.1 ribosome-associated protein [Paraburkholderia sp. WP4_3_2]MBB6103780.1 ribosome-associated protein [Paraburkholderia bannensis]
MDIRKLQRTIVDALEDVKAQDIRVFNTSHLTELFDRVVVASGTSNRQTKALANSVREAVKEAGGDIVSTEGEDIGEWVLVDCGDAVVHILQPALRQYYNLEEIWGDKPVRLKLAANTGFVGARPSEPMDEEDEDEGSDKAPVAAKKPARKTAARKTAK